MSNSRIRKQLVHYVPESSDNLSRTDAATLLLQKTWRGSVMRRVWELLKQTRGNGDAAGGRGQSGFQKVAESGEVVRKHVVKAYRRLAAQASNRHQFAESVKHLRTALSVAAGLRQHNAARKLQVLFRAHLAFRKMCKPLPFLGLSLVRQSPVESSSNNESEGTYTS